MADLPQDHPLHGSLDIEGGRIVTNDDCPVCSEEIVTFELTPEQARQLAAVLVEMAAETHTGGE